MPPHHPERQLFLEWATARDKMRQPPWYKSPMNWVLIATCILIMTFAAAILYSLHGGGHDPVPFPGKERVVPSWRG